MPLLATAIYSIIILRLVPDSEGFQVYEMCIIWVCHGALQFSANKTSSRTHYDISIIIIVLNGPVSLTVSHSGYVPRLHPQNDIAARLRGLKRGWQLRRRRVQFR